MSRNNEDELCQQYDWIVKAQVCKFIARHPDQTSLEDDLLQDGRIAMLLAIRKFDGQRAALNTWITRSVAWALQESRRKIRAIQVPKYQHNNPEAFAQSMTVNGGTALDASEILGYSAESTRDDDVDFDVRFSPQDIIQSMPIVSQLVIDGIISDRAIVKDTRTLKMSAENLQFSREIVGGTSRIVAVEVSKSRRSCPVLTQCSMIIGSRTRDLCNWLRRGQEQRLTDAKWAVVVTMTTTGPIDGNSCRRDRTARTASSKS
jgi:hypothetical protein